MRITESLDVYFLNTFGLNKSWLRSCREPQVGKGLLLVKSIYQYGQCKDPVPDKFTQTVTQDWCRRRPSKGIIS